MKTFVNTYISPQSREIFIHSFIGLAIGYFVLHPVSMVIYWFEFNQESFSLTAFFHAFQENFHHSFSLHMMPMSVAFSILGLIIGTGSGIYSNSIKAKQKALQIKKQVLNQNIPTLISQGETEFVEFKSSLRHDYRQVKTDKNLEHIILKSIAGFLNAKGGTLLIGVNDYGEILGLENDYLTLKKKNKDGFQQRLITLISNEFGKDICPKVHVSFHTLAHKEICTLLVEPAHRPVFLREGNRTVFYLRTGNVTNPLTTSETVKYLESRKKQ